MLYYDAVCYGPEELAFVERVISRAANYEGKDEGALLSSSSLLFSSLTFLLWAELAYVDRVNERKDLTAPEGVFPGVDRIMFGTFLLPSRSLFSQKLNHSFPVGTDHPFFPPLEGDGPRWKSVDENLEAIAGVAGWSDEERSKVMGQNAVALFGLEL
jgi:aminocarboxymuconate-semialdehyde decarboxylase